MRRRSPHITKQATPWLPPQFRATNPTSVNRRHAIAGAAAAAGALAITGPALADVPKPDRLAMLVDRYYAEVDAFNSAGDMSDEETDALGDETYRKTLGDMIGVPATTAAGALAALAFLERETMEEYFECGHTYMFNTLIQSLVKAVRGHIERRA